MYFLQTVAYLFREDFIETVRYLPLSAFVSIVAVGDTSEGYIMFSVKSDFGVKQFSFLSFVDYLCITYTTQRASDIGTTLKCS